MTHHSSTMTQAVRYTAIVFVLCCGIDGCGKARQSENTSTGGGGSSNGGATQGGGGASLVGAAGASGGAGADIAAVRPPEVVDAPVLQGRSVTLAVESFLLGDVDWNGQVRRDAWLDYSFDLDGLDSTIDSLNHCSGGSRADQADGPQGEDNGFATELMQRLHDFSETRLVSQQTDDAIAAGTRTLLFRIDDLADSGPQSGVEVATFVGADAVGTPAFEGQDTWNVRESSVVGGDPNAPALVYHGYIADDVFVASAPVTQPLEITLRGHRLVLPIRHAIVSFDVAALRAGKRTVNGVITGAMATADISEPIARLAQEMFVYCDLDYPGHLVGDIRSDLTNGDPSVECDAFSVGIGFTAVRAEVGAVVPDEPERDPCASGVATSDGTVGGSCDAIPAPADAVVCTPVQRAAPVYPEHRASVAACEHERPRGPVCPVPSAGQGSYDDSVIACYCHDQCSAGVNGRCYAYGYSCSYDECFVDDDCGAGRLCQCNGGADGNHVCLPADCRTDADCAAGLLCRPTQDVQCFNLSGVVGYYCETSADECRSDADCGGGACVFDTSLGHWACTDSVCYPP